MKVLVIEDEHKIANSIKQGLEQEKFIVDVAFAGQTGLDLAVSEDYDVIILDRLLPEIDGVEIVKKVRSSNIHTPILFLTAKGQIEDRVEGLNAGADDYLTKPFAFLELLARVRALTRRPKAALDSLLTFADLTLDSEKFEVKRAGKVIQLSNREFSLLEFLLRHPNQIFKKEQIIRSIWSYDADILPNTVEVYINHLRDKVDDGFKIKLIHTVRGFGYKLSET
ncbi:MAG TPA: response regulator transcription factor [Patescibacteria group bacterium]